MKVVLLIFALTLKFEYFNSMWPLTLTSSKDMDIDRGTTQSIKSRSNKSGRIQKRHKKNRSSIVFPSGASKARVSKRKWYGYYKEWNPRIIITFVSWSWVYFSFSFWLFMIPKKSIHFPKYYSCLFLSSYHATFASGKCSPMNGWRN